MCVLNRSIPRWIRHTTRQTGMLRKHILVFIIATALLATSVYPVVTSADLLNLRILHIENNCVPRTIDGGVLLDGWLVQEKLLASDGQVNDWFGCSVSLYDDTALIGARTNDVGFDSGAAYIFRYTNGAWIQQIKLQASDGAEGDNFGNSVSLYGNTALIGAYEDDDNGDSSGSAYIFEKIDGTWVQTSKLVPVDGAEDAWFGWAVSVFDKTAVVAARGKDFQHSLGVVYIYQQVKGSWVQQQKLMPSDGSPGDCFGESVSLQNDTLVIGATEYGSSGSVYIFQKNNGDWVQQMKLVPSDGAFGDAFGCSVSLSDPMIVVGSNGDDDNGELSGSAYLFQKNNNVWAEQKKLLASDGSGGDSFGLSVSISGDSVIIGARQDYDNLGGSGSAYLFKKISEDWVEEAKLWAADGTGLYFFFGGAVSIFNDTALIAAEGDNDNGDTSGSVYVFTIVGPNHSPDTPVIKGTVNGKTRTDYIYTVNTSDPDGNSQYVFWVWGDGYTNGWNGPFDNAQKIQETYWWLEQGTYTITVWLRDQYGAMSKGYLQVTMPTLFIPPILQLLQTLGEWISHIIRLLHHMKC
jgi:hypothetical protein